MDKYKIAPPMRLFFLVAGSSLWVGIWLTGVDVAHWLFYIPATFFMFAALTGICPGLIISRWLLGDKAE